MNILSFVVKTVINNPKLGLDVRKMSKTIKAMREFRKENPICAYTKTLPVKEVHHIKPVHFFPELAWEKTNMIGFGSRDIHLIIGHGGNFKHYNENVVNTANSGKILTS